jgi:hypothetical protein
LVFSFSFCFMVAYFTVVNVNEDKKKDKFLWYLFLFLCYSLFDIYIYMLIIIIDVILGSILQQSWGFIWCSLSELSRIGNHRETEWSMDFIKTIRPIVRSGCSFYNRAETGSNF